MRLYGKGSAAKGGYLGCTRVFSRIVQIWKKECRHQLRDNPDIRQERQILLSTPDPTEVRMTSMVTYRVRLAMTFRCQ